LQEEQNKIRIAHTQQAEEEIRRIHQETAEQYREFWLNIDRENLDRMNANLDREQEIHEFRMQMLEDEKEQRQALAQRAIEDLQVYGGAVGQVGGAFANVFGGLADRMEDGSDAAKKYGAIQGGILAAIAYVHAAIEYAAAISDLASQNYGAGSQHLASAIAYTAAGSMALADLGGSASAPPGGTGGASFVPERERVETTGEGGGTTIVIQAWGMDSSRMAQTVDQGRRRALRSGVDMPMVPAGGYS
jgi:hypothetical protein